LGVQRCSRPSHTLSHTPAPPTQTTPSPLFHSLTRDCSSHASPHIHHSRVLFPWDRCLVHQVQSPGLRQAWAPFAQGFLILWGWGSNQVCGAEVTTTVLRTSNGTTTINVTSTTTKARGARSEGRRPNQDVTNDIIPLNPSNGHSLASGPRLGSRVLGLGAWAVGCSCARAL
jgi:hypothetical protein